MRTHLSLLLLSLLLTGCTQLPSRTTSYDRSDGSAQMTDASLDEVSGITASRQADGVYWVHNDSGDEARIFAINEQGEKLGSVTFMGVKARDWEDIASFEWEGQSWLLIADVGDNDAVRDDLRLHFIPEPDLSRLDPNKPLHVTPSHTWRIAYPGGARDCEGVAVSAQTQEILLISKRTEPPVLYSLPLRFDSTPVGVVRVAQLVTPLPGIEPPTAMERALPGRLGQYRSQVTAFDLSADGTRAAVLTYGNIWLYQKNGDDSWATTFTRKPDRIPVTGLMQAEALCFVRDSHDLIVTTERLPAPIHRYPAK